MVVGHSLGGGIALLLAQLRPDLVGALVLVSSIGTAEAVSALDHMLASSRLGAKLSKAAVVSSRSAVRGVGHVADHLEQSARSAKRDRMIARHTPKLAGMARRLTSGPMIETLTMPDAPGGTTWESFMVEQRALLKESSQIEARLAQIAAPTAVVSGNRDRVVPMAVSVVLAERIPGAELVVVAGSGHGVPAEAPEQLASVIERYARLV